MSSENGKLVTYDSDEDTDSSSTITAVSDDTYSNTLDIILTILLLGIFVAILYINYYVI